MSNPTSPQLIGHQLRTRLPASVRIGAMAQVLDLPARGESMAGGTHTYRPSDRTNGTLPRRAYIGSSWSRRLLEPPPASVAAGART